ncbi:hypothetical protein Ocin01_19248 [Orchesella cincta]|uniref:Uncharacterized protein n=1 Tax=Orchesella cincta TaxID=48709 RepID=A0A1D2M383_ORCCI|nr:hypothetical protein Ocin01_19248 [Orchesella cincta]
MTEFFNVVQAVYKFFHASGIRWNELEIVCREGGLDKTQTSSITLKPVCETRWEARHASVLAIKARYIDLLKALSKIILVSKKKDELQTVDVALDECVVMWQNGIQSLQDLEKNLLSVQDEAKEIASKWGVPAVFSSSRVVKKTRFFDGIGIDTARRTIMSEESLFEATLRPVIVNLLTPSKILSLPENDLSVSVNRFCLQYSNDVSSNLFGELLNLKVAMSSELCKIEKISDILKLLMRSNLRESFPNVVTSCVFRMSQERLSGMALLSVEGKRAQALDIDSLIETFAKNKARRRPI